MLHPPFRCLVITAALLALCGCQRLFFAVLNGAVPEGTLSGIVYGPDPAHRLDVFLPSPARTSSTRPAPVVLFLHGGRWQDGHRGDYAFVGESLAAGGILTFVADYRQHPQVGFPVFVEDAARAAHWSIAHARDYGGDPERVYVMGHSAGAHIGALLATDARYLRAVGRQPRDLAGFVGLAGPYDFLPLTDADLKQIFGPPERWSESQPVNFVDGDEPPMLLLHGEDDALVWPRNSRSLARALEAAGVLYTLREYPDVGHIRLLGALRFDRLAPARQDVIDFVHAPP